jgi:hypothetical protein
VQAQVGSAGVSHQRWGRACPRYPHPRPKDSLVDDNSRAKRPLSPALDSRFGAVTPESSNLPAARARDGKGRLRPFLKPWAAPTAFARVISVAGLGSSRKKRGPSGAQAEVHGVAVAAVPTVRVSPQALQADASQWRTRPSFRPARLKDMTCVQLYLRYYRNYTLGYVLDLPSTDRAPSQKRLWVWQIEPAQTPIFPEKEKT